MKRFFSKQNRALLTELVRTDFKLRYQGSVLGYAWSLLRPLFLFAILYVVFVNFLRLGDDVENFPVYLLLGIVIWNFFTEMTVQGLGSVVNRGDLIRKISIPRWMIVFSSSLAAVINLILNLFVVSIFMIVSGVDVGLTLAWLPFILFEVYLFALGIALILSSLYVKYRDVGYIWEVVMQAGFYATPILYPLTLITSLTVQKLILLSPIAQAIQDARHVAVTEQSITIYQVFDGGPFMYIPFAIVLVTLLFGLYFFKKESKYFAENI